MPKEAVHLVAAVLQLLKQVRVSGKSTGGDIDSPGRGTHKTEGRLDTATLNVCTYWSHNGLKRIFNIFQNYFGVTATHTPL
jgi:hypothetical protein